MIVDRILRRATVAVIGLMVVLPVQAVDPSSVEARAEYLLRMSDSGLLPTPMMIAMLRDPYPETKVLAIRVVAASSDPSQSLLLWEYLRDRDFRVRYQVMIAAGRLGEDGKELAFRGLRDGVPKVRQAAAWAATHGGAEALEPLRSLMAEETDVGVRATALANLWRFGDADWHGWASAAAAGGDVQLRRAAAFSLSRSGSPKARAALRRLAADREAVIRASAVSGLGRAPLARDDLMVLARAVQDPDPRVRTAACGALAAQPTPAVADEVALVVAAMWTPTEPQLAVMALRAAGSRPEIGDDAALLDIAADGEPWLASEALAALVRRGGAKVDEIASVWRSSDELWRRRAVAVVAPVLGGAWEQAAAEDPEATVRLAWLEPLDADQIAARIEILRDLVAADPDPMVRTVALNHLARNGAAGSFDQLIGLARSWSDDEMPDARSAALSAALAATEDEERRALVIERAIDDRNPAVGVAVVNAARSLGLPARSHQREPRHGHQWYLDLVEWMKGRHWLDVVTDRGTIRIRLETIEAPISAREIFDLAAAGFYDGLTFHRVVPNFVVQGGDPRGDGWGGPGFILPDEVAFRPFDTGRVGIATSGPNSGGSQLFMTLMPADHLVGHYTNLGDVVAGREVLTRLRVGDRIRRVEAFSGDEPAPPSPVLLGRLGWSELAEIPGWGDEYRAAQPSPDVVDRLATAAGDYRIVTVLGTWCHDSRREVPRLVRVLDEIDAPVFSHELIGVDRTRRIDDVELAHGAGVERTVERVATIVVFDGDGMELGRVVETAERPIEELLLEFIAPAEGW
jgi:cyclophilin family peptidyl-prolyl cis-trans isomerase/HEAT repeat protein